ncbi:DUF3135 domain-containing protein [Geomonas sp. Red69]|uniref:DUF3135 domain-containing protein n=1 Tax=Geomonas diazotrophica TaxID=2843197 RepID=A0ABX8JCW6_9BACT|nr:MULTISPECIES: DUF3135 domain-containing protein [Geomonas]MBU5636259.1 DUF3135 domain-containing protein [Geomonas diazotrophica]QWV96153.1 DUF3135 domain-containing protein [Geomonas nitrogeniifigens]QXE85220.1 DUF3135 domain-containing protein [Geomonas nitrogeniifigens]
MSTKREFTAYTPDELRELYKENPAMFDELADEALKKACRARTPEKTLKLQQMQWSMTMQMRRASSNLGRMHVMENIFYTQVYGKNGQLEKLVDSCNTLLRAIGKKQQIMGKEEESVKLRRV